MCHFPCRNGNRVETEKATPLTVLFGWSLKIDERIRGQKTTVWMSEHLMMSQKKKEKKKQGKRHLETAT